MGKKVSTWVSGRPATNALDDTVVLNESAHVSSARRKTFVRPSVRTNTRVIGDRTVDVYVRDVAKLGVHGLETRSRYGVGSGCGAARKVKTEQIGL